MRSARGSGWNVRAAATSFHEQSHRCPMGARPRSNAPSRACCPHSCSPVQNSRRSRGESSPGRNQAADSCREQHALKETERLREQRGRRIAQRRLQLLRRTPGAAHRREQARRGTFGRHRLHGNRGRGRRGHRTHHHGRHGRKALRLLQPAQEEQRHLDRHHCPMPRNPSGELNRSWFPACDAGDDDEESLTARETTGVL